MMKRFLPILAVFLSTSCFAVGGPSFYDGKDPSTTREFQAIYGLLTNGNFETLKVGTATITQVNAIGVPITHYRKPNLKYASSTEVDVETGTVGTSGQGTILFPDGAYYTDTNSWAIRCVVTSTANWGNGTMVGGNAPGEQLGSNLWKNFYAVKSSATGNTSNYVIVASTYQPIQSNFSALNSKFGANGWSYLGVIAYGDGSGSPLAVPLFGMAGNRVTYRNISSASSEQAVGILMTSANAASLAWSYASGTSTSGQVPAQLIFGSYSSDNSGNSSMLLSSTGNNIYWLENTVSLHVQTTEDRALIDGFRVTTIGSGSTALNIILYGYIDGALGVGGNPVL